MKKTISIILVLAMALSLCACGKTEEKIVLKIGVMEPSGGDMAAMGSLERLGIEFANSLCPVVEIDDRVCEVEMVYAENVSDGESAAAAAQDLIDKGVSLVLGACDSKISLAAGAVLDGAGIPCLGISCTDPAVTEGNGYYFRLCHLDSFEGRALGLYARNVLGASKVYCLSQLGDAYSTTLSTAFISAFEGAGGECVSESFEAGTTSFTGYFEGAVTEGCQAVFLPVGLELSSRILSQAADVRVESDQPVQPGQEKAWLLMPPMIAGSAWDTKAVLDLVQGKNLDLTVAAMYPEGGDPEFERDYKEWLNASATRVKQNGGDDSLNAVTVLGYDAYFFALEALKNAGGGDTGRVKEALWTTQYNGLTGHIEFEQLSGDAVRDTCYLKHANVSLDLWDNLLPVIIE